jgi:hypothetical protein
MSQRWARLLRLFGMYFVFTQYFQLVRGTRPSPPACGRYPTRPASAPPSMTSTESSAGPSASVSSVAGRPHDGWTGSRRAEGGIVD